MKIYLLAIYCFIPISVYAQSQDTPDQPRAENSKIVSNTFVFDTHLFDLEYIGQLKAIRKKPFLIFVGTPCDSCDANPSLYIHSATDGPLKDMHKQKRYNLPGPIYDYQTKEMLYVARLFWGEVIPGRFGLIWFQKESKNMKWVESVYFAELVNDHIVNEFVTCELKVALEQLEKKKAWEIKGEPMNSEP